jgi:hypothetical protein
MEAVKKRSGFVTFFLRLAGRDPVQKQEHERFRKNLAQHDECEQRLDDIMEGIEKVNTTVRRKERDIAQTADSLSPPRLHHREGK